MNRFFRTAILVIPLLVACDRAETDNEATGTKGKITPQMNGRLALLSDGSQLDLDCTAKVEIKEGASPNEIRDKALSECRVESGRSARGHHRRRSYEVYYYLPYYWDNYYTGYSGSSNYSCSLMFGSRARGWNFDCIYQIGGYSPSYAGSYYNNYCTTYCHGSFSYSCHQPCGQSVFYPY